MDTQKVAGRVRLQNYSIESPVLRFVIRVLQFFGANNAVQVLAQAHGVLQWDTGFKPNIITTVGKAQLSALAGSVVTPFTYLAVGTSATTPAAADTTLGAETTTSGLGRAAATFSQVTTSTLNDTSQWAHTWSVTGTVTIQEVGVLNASSAGTLLGHALTGSKAVNNGDVLIGTYQVQFQ